MAEQKEQYRLVTRSDFDGLVCAIFLKHLNLIDDIKFVHPKDMQDGKIAISDKDITTNLPYVKGVHLAFDHHFSETLRNKVEAENHIIDADAPSAARVVYNYYGGEKAFPKEWVEMLEAVDKADSAQFSEEEILNPTKWVLLNFIMDPRTGLGRFRTFRVSNYNLMMHLIDYCRTYSIEEILALPDVQERADLYLEHQEKFKQQLAAKSTVKGNVVLLDLTEEEVIYAGNRFMIYAMYPQTTISIHRLWGLKKQNTVFAVGKSIINRSSKANIGEVMLQYGGGGHPNAGTCQIDNNEADSVQEKLIDLFQD